MIALSEMEFATVVLMDPGKVYSLSMADGLLGALPAFLGTPDRLQDLRLAIMFRSLAVIASDRRCRWLILPAEEPMKVLVVGEGKPSSPLDGLVLINPRPEPDLPSPPMNSLVLRRCPPLLGVVADGESGDGGWVTRSGVSLTAGEGWKVKDGNAETLLRLPCPDMELYDSEPVPASYADSGLRPVDREYDAGAEEGSGRAGNTKGGFGRGPPSSGTEESCTGKRCDRGDTSSSWVS